MSSLVCEMTQGAPVSTIATQSEAAAAQESAISPSPLLRLPMELQLQIYCMVLEVEVDECRDDCDITVADMGLRRFAERQLPIKRTCYEMSLNCNTSYCLVPGPELVHSASKEYVDLHLGLLLVNREIRTVTLPIFYGHNCFKLYIVKGFIPFFSDRGESARQNIRMLRIDLCLIGTDADDLSWKRNIAYIKTSLTGLKSLSMKTNYFCEFTAADRFLDSFRTDPLSAISDHEWLSSLASLRGLSNFQFKCYYHEDYEDGITCPDLKPETMIELRNYLSNKVCQPRDPENELVSV